MVTNFHLNTTDVASFQMFVYGDVVYAQTWYSDPEKLNRATFICQDGLCCCNMALISFRLFRKNLGKERCFWANGLPPPLAKNFPYAYDGCWHWGAAWPYFAGCLFMSQPRCNCFQQTILTNYTLSCSGWFLSNLPPSRSCLSLTKATGGLWSDQ